MDGAPPNKRPKTDTETKPSENGKQDEKLIYSKFDFVVKDEKPVTVSLMKKILIFWEEELDLIFIELFFSEGNKTRQEGQVCG